MNNFPQVDDFIIRKREDDWLVYEGESLEMVHGFSLELRPDCDYAKTKPIAYFIVSKPLILYNIHFCWVYTKSP